MEKEKIVKELLKVQAQKKIIDKNFNSLKELLLEKTDPSERIVGDGGIVTVYTISKSSLKKGINEDEIKEKFPEYVKTILIKEFYSDLKAAEYIEFTDSRAVRVNIKETESF